MRKLFLLFALSILLQVGFYIVFLHENYVFDDFSYNIVSCISLGGFTIYFLVKTFHSLKHNVFRNIFISIIIAFFMFIFILFVGFFSNFITSTLYTFFYDSFEHPNFSDSFLMNILEYHFVVLQLVIFILNLFAIVSEAGYSNHYARKLHIAHKILSVVIIILLIHFMTSQFDVFYYYVFYLVSLLVYWMCIPFFYFLCNDYDYFYGVAIAWCGVIVFFWMILDVAFGTFKDVYGFM